MSKTNLEQFYRELLKDRALQERLKALNDTNSIVALVVEAGKEKGYSFTIEEVQEDMAEINMSRPQQELSDEQLEAIAGGTQQRLAYLDGNCGCGGGGGGGGGSKPE